MSNKEKVDWWGEQLDTYYKKMGHPKKVWKDNEGLPYGIYYYFDKENDPFGSSSGKIHIFRLVLRKTTARFKRRATNRKQVNLVYVRN